VLDHDAAAVHQAVGRLAGRHVDLGQLAADLDAEAQARPLGGEAGLEEDLAVSVAQPSEAGHERRRKRVKAPAGLGFPVGPVTYSAGSLAAGAVAR
jgi:hypothetical protein